MRRRVSSRSVASSLSLRVIRNSGHGVWLTLAVGGGSHCMIKSKGTILPQDYRMEGVSSLEKRFCHPDCDRASILVETSSSHSQFRKLEKRSIFFGGESFRSARVLEASDPSAPITGQDPPLALERNPCSASQGDRDLFLLEFKPQRAERPKRPKRFLSLRPMKCPFTPGPSTSTKLIES
jgi:hypothetical protein